MYFVASHEVVCVVDWVSSLRLFVFPKFPMLWLVDTG